MHMIYYSNNYFPLYLDLLASYSVNLNRWEIWAYRNLD